MTRGRRGSGPRMRAVRCSPSGGSTAGSGSSFSQGTQSADLMVAEPTVFSQSWFDGFGGSCREVVDCSALLG